MAHAVEDFKVQAIAKAERETAEREEKNCELQAARRVELHNLAESFEAAVGNIIENVGSASSELENSAGYSDQEQRGNPTALDGRRGGLGRDIHQRPVGRLRDGGDGRLDQ